MIYDAGALVKSKAGHDKGDLFVIVKENGEYVVLVDGNKRVLEKPKRKNKKHVQIIHHSEEPQLRKLIEETRLTDEAVRRCLAKVNRAFNMQPSASGTQKCT